MRLAPFFVGFVAASTLLAVSSVMAVPNEQTDVFRAQLEIKTCDLKNAKTDDPVSAQVNSAGKTYLDYGRNDFERNRLYMYDLDLEGVSTLADITMLRIHKTGSNGTCLASVRLFINDAPIFSQSFGAKGRWLDGNETGRTLLFSSAQLRANPAWQNYSFNFWQWIGQKGGIPREEIESRIESAVGTAIHGTKLYWGFYHGRAVEVKRKDLNTLTVDLDLGLRVKAWWDPEVDINFDIPLCDNNTFVMKITNVRVNVDSRWYSEVLSFGVAEIIDHKAIRQIKKKMSRLGTAVGAGKTLPICPHADSEGNISF